MKRRRLIGVANVTRGREVGPYCRLATVKRMKGVYMTTKRKRGKREQKKKKIVLAFGERKGRTQRKKGETSGRSRLIQKGKQGESTNRGRGKEKKRNRARVSQIPIGGGGVGVGGRWSPLKKMMSSCQRKKGQEKKKNAALPRGVSKERSKK